MLSNFLRSRWAAFCFLAIVAFAVFGRAIWFDYVNLDEGVLLISNEFFITKIGNIFEIFKHDLNYPSAAAPYYRPILTLSFMLNSQIKSSPTAYHIGNLLIYFIVSFLVFLLFLELGHKKRISAIFAAIFTVHPAVAAIAVWVPGRNDSLLAIFVVLSFLFFIKFLKTDRWLYLGLYFVVFALGLLTKELILLLPVLLFFYFRTSDVRWTSDVKTRSRRISNVRILTWLGGSAVIVVAWFFIRKIILDKIQLVDLSLFKMLVIMWSNILAILLYLGKILLPFDLTVLPVLEKSGFIYGSVVLAVILALFWIGRRMSPQTTNIRILGLVWFVIFLAPSLVSYDQPVRMIFFEHRLYLPMLGLFIFFISLVPEHRTSYRFLLPAAGVFVLFSVLAFNYSGFYKDKMTFWQKAVADSPQSSRAHNGLASSYIVDGKLEEAEAEFKKALALNPKEKRIHLLLGLSYLDKKMYSEAQTELEKEIEVDPKQFVAYHNLGRIYAQNKNLKKAEEFFLKTVEINPDYVLARQDLVVLYYSQNKHPQAIVQLKELLRVQKPEAMHPQILKILETYTKEAARQQGF